ncbi:right-handed parallel beta-helix repeat-containing protein, partial [bacterium]|nr:right-handed parallel beta-helix repeat-containing protein [bacterium]
MAALLGGRTARAAILDVAPSGAPFSGVQAALDAALPGDVVRLHAGTWHEKVSFPRSGSPGAPIALEAAPGETAVLDGTGVAGSDMVRIANRSHVAVRGLEIRNLAGVTDGSGIRVVGSGDSVEIRGNHVHDVRGRNAMGITVYATGATPVSGLVVADNRVHDCEPAPSEAITLNGNVDGFEVTGNVVTDVNNIGIDVIGGET